MNTRKSELLSPAIERVLKQIILKDLTNKGRPEWDRPHTEAVVYWMKELLTQLNAASHQLDLNPKVLITAAYAHDWGYASLFSGDKKLSIAEILPKKQLHMQRGAEMIERLLYQRLATHFTQAEIFQVVHLVSVHDKVRELTTESELLLMEADTLGMLDTTRAPKTHGPEEEQGFLKHSIYELRLPRFIHPQAKIIAEQLLKIRKNQ